MFGVRTPRTGFAGRLPRYVGLLMIAGTISVAGQSAHSAPIAAPQHRLVLPEKCLSPAHSSDKIAELLEGIHDHPTAGAFNTLGVLYAQQDQVSCAISAFEASLRSQDQNWEAHYNLAIALLRRGDRTRANRELQTAIAQKPDSVNSRYALASVLEEEKKFSEAEEQLRTVLTQDPKFAPATLMLARVLIDERKPQQAIESLEEGIKQQPRTEQTESLWSALGVAYAENGQLEKGLRALTNFIAAQPNSGDAHLQLGLLFLRGDGSHQAEAIDAFRKALRLDGNLDAARLALGQTLIATQNFTEAVPVLLDYTARKHNDAHGFSALGLCYQGLNQSEPAIQAFRRSVELNSHDAATRLALGKLLASAGRTDAAIRQLQEAEHMSPADAEIHRQLLLLLEKTGRKVDAQAERSKLSALRSQADKDMEIGRLNEEASQLLGAGNAKAAAEKYQRAVQLNATNAKLRYNLSIALDRLGDVTAEKKELLKAVELDPRLFVAQNQLGLLALNAGQRQEAEIRFKKAIEAEPGFAEAQSNLAVVYSQKGKISEAASLFQEAIKNDPNHSKAHVNYGLLLVQQASLVEAEQQFRTAIQVNEKDANAYSALGMLLAKTGRTPDAAACFRKAVELEPTSAQAHLNLGIALADQFDRTAALNEFSEAARLDPQLPAVHYNLGRFHYEGGKYGAADQELTTAVRLQPNYVGALYFLALATKQENQTERSTELLQKVVQLQPENADAQYLLGQDLDHLGDHQSAIEHWKAALRADPYHSQALFNLAKSLGKTHDPGAKQYQDRFEALQKEQQLADRVSELGNLAIQAANSKNWPQALQQMNEAIQLCGNCRQSAHLHKNLGLFYDRAGNVDEAKKELRTALKLEPNDSDVRNALAALERTHEEQTK
jgi:tetratricopeptide (TPR) repeat protein